MLSYDTRAAVALSCCCHYNTPPKLPISFLLSADRHCNHIEYYMIAPAAQATKIKCCK